MHLDDQLINSYLDNEVSNPWKSQVEAHLEWCETCRERVRELESLKARIQDAGLSQEAIKTSQNRVLRFLENNRFKKEQKSFIGRFRELLGKKILWPVYSAMATFCVCLLIFLPMKSKVIQVPDTPSVVSLDQIRPVRASDNYTTGKTLSQYSLEEILEYLDASGYEVDIKVKGITPLEPEEPEETVFVDRIIAPEQPGFTLKTVPAFTFKF